MAHETHDPRHGGLRLAGSSESPLVTGTAGLRDAVITSFSGDIGRAPDGVWGAPGRVNLIGEHTDYNDGFVMPFALAQRVVVAAASRVDRRWTVTSLNYGQRAEFGLEDLHPGMPGWAAYVAGIVWALGMPATKSTALTCTWFPTSHRVPGSLHLPPWNVPS